MIGGETAQGVSVKKETPSVYKEFECLQQELEHLVDLSSRIKINFMGEQPEEDKPCSIEPAGAMFGNLVSLQLKLRRVIENLEPVGRALG